MRLRRTLLATLTVLFGLNMPLCALACDLGKAASAAQSRRDSDAAHPLAHESVPKGATAHRASRDAHPCHDAQAPAHRPHSGDCGRCGGGGADVTLTSATAANALADASARGPLRVALASGPSDHWTTCAPGVVPTARHGVPLPARPARALLHLHSTLLI